MRKLLIQLMLAFVLTFGAVPMHAQELTPGVLQDLMRLAAQELSLYQRLLGISQTMPQPSPGDDPALVVRQGRSWVAASRQVVSEVRSAAAGLPPTPGNIPPDLRKSYDAQRNGLPEVASGMEQLLERYAGALDAIERRDARAAVQMVLSTLDAGAFTVRLLRDINTTQADSLGADHPQSHLLRSVSRSYDAMLAVLAHQRAHLSGEGAGASGAAQVIAAVASDMRRSAESGRLAAASMSVVVGAERTSNAEQAALKDRTLTALRTYSGSFDREVDFAGALDSMARLLGERRRYEDIAQELNQMMSRLATLDDERGTDMQQRMAILQGQ